RNFVSTHFFSYKYDYRHEWLQFIRLISAQESLLPLHDRVVQAIANIVDAPAGALWILRDDGFVNTSPLNAPLSRETQRSPPGVVEWFETGARIGEVGAADGADADDAPPIPSFLSGLPRAWIVVPLVHRHHLLGFLVLARPRAPRRLDAEDRD